MYLYKAADDFDLCALGDVVMSEQLGGGGEVKLDASGRPYRRSGANADELGLGQIRLSGIVHGDTAAAFAAQCMELRTMHGTQVEVERERQDTLADETALCDFSVQWGDVLGRGSMQEVTLTMAPTAPFSPPNSTPSEVLNVAESLVNTGTMPITNAVVTVTMTNSTSSLTITGGGNDLTLTMALVNTDVVVIDCGARTVKKNGALQDVTVTRGASHQYSDWLVIPVGGADITVGNGSGTVSYNLPEGANR